MFLKKDVTFSFMQISNCSFSLPLFFFSIVPSPIFNLFFFLSRDGIYNNDIAVIRIRRKGDGSGITFSEKVSPACLPRRAFEEGKECFIAGWGKTKGQIERHVTWGSGDV